MLQEKNIIARNILILEQLKEVIKAFGKQNIDVILLKGVSMLTLFPEYIREREMEDIDLLVRKSDIIRAKDTLISLGYEHVPDDPWAFTPVCPNSDNPRGQASTASGKVDIDLCCDLWYLDSKENIQLWHNAIPVNIDSLSNAYILSPIDMFVHISAHCAVHHCEKYMDSAGNKWERDLKLILEKYKLSPDTIKKELKKNGLLKPYEIYMSRPVKTGRYIFDNRPSEDGRYKNVASQFIGTNCVRDKFYYFLLKHQIPNRGHILRFIILPLNKKLLYLYKTIFPANDFIKNRYNLKNSRQILTYRFLRIALLLRGLINFSNNFINHLVFHRNFT
ncbi:MAG: hypothetical protein AUJ85_04940 [Elusimicrobia bacterium CG1_02_37_114]|nr:MAG: hypothetical protein AUJ85_04940 [Elusimicrobia bacterium CG1_02_37_114]